MLPLDALHVECFVGLARASVAFVCRRCARRDAAWIDAGELCAIAAAGVVLHVSARPSEIDEHPSFVAPVLSGDDLIDFHFLLERADWFEQVDPHREAG